MGEQFKQTTDKVPQALTKPKKVTKASGEMAERVKEEGNKLKTFLEKDKKDNFKVTMERMKKDRQYLGKMSDKEYDALKSFLVSLVDANVTDVKKLRYNIDGPGNLVGIHLKNGGYLIIDTAKMIARGYASSMGTDRSVEASLKSDDVKNVLKHGGTLLDYIGEKDKLPSMDEFKGNWSKGRYLAKYITELGVQAKCVTADRSWGLTGSIQIDNPKGGIDLIDSLYNKEIIQGYRLKLKPSRYNNNMIEFEYVEK